MIKEFVGESGTRAAAIARAIAFAATHPDKFITRRMKISSPILGGISGNEMVSRSPKGEIILTDRFTDMDS